MDKKFKDYKRPPEVRPDLMLAQPGEIAVDVKARIFLDAKQFSLDPERTVLDCLIELGNAIRKGDGTIKRAVVKSYWFVKEGE